MNPSQTQANILAGQLLVIAARKVSVELDRFSGWLAAGFGAALALFIANLDTISKFIAPYSIRNAAILFLISAVLAVFEKLLAAFVAAGTTAGIKGAALGKEIAEREIAFDIPAFFMETKRALYWPGRFFADRAFAKTHTGDFAGPGRIYAKTAQLQALTVITQALLSLAAAAIIIFGLAP